MQKTLATVPPASTLVFQNGISHPELWLWDSWTMREGNKLHLYCLALSRSINGVAITPGDRNDHRFHVRHFLSSNNGQSWHDLGPALLPESIPDSSDSRNVWSGSVTRLGPGVFLFAQTGIKQSAPERPFVQSVNASISSSPETVTTPERALLCPERDYDAIVGAGYYLSERSLLGHRDGEAHGPILAWRDPFTFLDTDGELHLFFSAKVDPKTPAIAHALLNLDNNLVSVKTLLDPITLPDSDAFTQAEVPKIYRDEKRDLYFLLISACNRLYEGQPDGEVAKQHRLYKATSLEGPWVPYRKAGSLLPNMEHLFGASIVDADFDSGTFTFIAPYTEMAAPGHRLTFAPLHTINIYEDEVDLTSRRA